MTRHETFETRSFRDTAPLPLASGNSFRRLLAAKAIASIRHSSAADIAAQLWPSDRTVAAITRAASAPAMTSVAGWAAELAQKVVHDALAGLGAASTGAELLRSGLVLAWDGAGIISAPGFVASATAGGFVAEGQPIPVRQLSATAAQLLPYKLASIGVLTYEMMISSNAENLIGDVLMRSAALALDAALFDSNAATSARPAGLRNGISASTPSSSTDPFGAVFEDVTTLVNAIAAVAGNGPYALIASPGRSLMIRARFSQDVDDPTLPIYASNAVGGDLVAVAPEALVAALDPAPTVETAPAGELHMSDTPAAIVNGGAPAAPSRSLFQTESIAVKVRWPLSWALRDSRGVAWLTPTWK
jgi:hypothetical protein